jgi:hypothetical protein
MPYDNLLTILTGFADSNEYGAQVIKLLGGRVEYGLEASKQGGGGVVTAAYNARGGRIMPPKEIFNVEHLAQHCRDNSIVFVMSAIGDRKVLVTCARHADKTETAVGYNIGCTWAACIIMLTTDFGSETERMAVRTGTHVPRS